MSNTHSNQGPGLGTFLTLLFIGLKLTGVISWSWWWVLSPLWIGFALFFVVLIVVGIISIFTK